MQGCQISRAQIRHPASLKLTSCAEGYSRNCHPSSDISAAPVIERSVKVSKTDASLSSAIHCAVGASLKPSLGQGCCDSRNYLVQLGVVDIAISVLFGVHQLPVHFHFKPSCDLGSPFTTNVQLARKLLLEFLFELLILGFIASGPTYNGVLSLTFLHQIRE